jgi:hypothetical protein
MLKAPQRLWKPQAGRQKASRRRTGGCTDTAVGFDPTRPLEFCNCDARTDRPPHRSRRRTRRTGHPGVRRTYPAARVRPVGAGVARLQAAPAAGVRLRTRAKAVWIRACRAVARVGDARLRASRRFGAAAFACERRAKAGEPKFHQLEPDQRMVAPARRSPGRRLTSRLLDDVAHLLLEAHP